MSTIAMILGPSGSGKSTGLRTIDPATSFLFRAINKPLPFKGAKSAWTEVTTENKAGNVVTTDDPEKIVAYLERISKARPEIKSVFIDDSQYIMANEFMRSANEKGYEKFTRIGLNFWNLITRAANLRDDLVVFFLHHTDTTDLGEVKAKTIGKMLDDKITVEGMFTIVLRAAVRDGKHVFLTQNSGHDTVKSPMGMFEDAQIDNDLKAVLEAIQAY